MLRLSPTSLKPVFWNLSLVIGARCIRLGGYDQCFDHQVQATAFPTSDITIRSIRRFQENTGRFESAMLVLHLLLYELSLEFQRQEGYQR